MLVRLFHQRARRRGIVLVLILGMLSLLALIGVTFATISGQAKVNSRNFLQAQVEPDATTLMNFALAQLIDDTSNPLSALRGHSLRRDMYGNDAWGNGYLTGRPTDNAQIVFTGVTVSAAGNALDNTIQCVTNIALNDNAFYGYDFTRWIVKIGGQSTINPNTGAGNYLVAQTYEILFDDPTGNSNPNFRVFYLAPSLKTAGVRQNYVSPLSNPPTNASQLIGEAAAAVALAGGTNPPPNPPPNGGVYVPPNIVPAATAAGVAPVPVNTPVILDGRFLRAFNGPGMGPLAVYGNFRVNGPLMPNPNDPSGFWTGGMLGDPDIVGMDEDYDACDLENWFLAIQSADGQVVIPSFHRPGILRADPTYVNFPTNPVSTAPIPSPANATAGSNYNDWRNLSADSSARFLRPRAVDGHNQISFPDLLPDPTTGKINYDVDNDGDGVTDAVWLDLGYPALRNAEGQLYKPLFAFTVIGLNGRIPLNTAGNLQHRDGNGQPIYAHASHLGTSPSEFDPVYALQNADDRQNRINLVLGVPNTTLNYSQFDNSDFNSGFTPNNNVLNSAGQIGVNGNTSPLPVNLTQLRNILAGTCPSDNPISPSGVNQDSNYVFVNGQKYYLPNNIYDLADAVPFLGNVPASINRGTAPVAGRWGEGSSVPTILPGAGGGPPGPYNNYVRAGLSKTLNIGGVFYYLDADDDNNDTTDPYPPYIPGQTGQPPLSYPEAADLYDLSGALPLPVERIRRYVTPIDAAGDGRILQYNDNNNPPQIKGPDSFGRLLFYKYFRPPGLPTISSTPPTLLNPFASAPVRPYDRRENNRYHGYESYRDVAAPNQMPAGVTSTLLFGAAPSNLNGTYAPVPPQPGTSPPTAPNTTVVSFDAWVNANNPAAGVPTFISPNLNDADEMTLYQTSENDQPFGPSDLEWLYRSQDSDGGSLSSRLASLAPVSFTNPLDGVRRRRLFSIDSWETNAFVWANDNPGAAFTGNSSFAAPLNYTLKDANVFTTNASFFSASNAGLTLAQYAGKALGTYSNGLPNGFLSNPSLAHRDRKINLNYPLPVSDNPKEPTRIKWITEAYELMLKILPPLAVDTPEEHAALSQYLTNVIDFRDPDATMTHFVSPDVVMTPGGGGKPATLSFGTPNPPTTFPLEQFGMEYNPVVLNEVLAYQYNRKDTVSNNIKTTGRFFFELLNTLTQTNEGTTTDTSAANLTDWDLVLVKDDGTNRPDPTTGQILDPTSFGTTNFGRIPLYANAFQTATTGGGFLTSAPANVSIPPLTTKNGNNTYQPQGGTNPGSFYTIGDKNPDQTPSNVEVLTFQPDQVVISLLDWFNAPPANSQPPQAPPGQPPFAAVTQVPPLGNNTSAYYWLCLRRPASALPVSLANPSQSFGINQPNPMVVVDAIRFPYIEGGGIGIIGNPDTMNNPGKPGQNALYSWQRLQPYRGGHAIISPYDTNTPPTIIDTHYGFTEQMAPPTTLSGTYGLFSQNATGGTGNARAITKNIYHTLNKANDGQQGGTNIGGTGTGGGTGGPGSGFDPWDYFAFNDRDFTSVIELTMVPGSPPGLFTKQFVENAPNATWATTNATPPQTTTPPTTPPTPPPPPLNANPPTYPKNPNNTGTPPTTPVLASLPVQSGIPQVYPFLMDEFFYTAASPANLGTTPPLATVGGLTGAGWFKMLEFFEVPSPVQGALGDTTGGFNYDWARQDLKPGLVNLNLIVDEEVFLALMGNAGLVNEDDDKGQFTALGPNKTPWALSGGQMINPSEQNQIAPASETGAAGYAWVPKVVTMANPITYSPVDFSTVVNTNPNYAAYFQQHLASYPMKNQGLFDLSFTAATPLLYNGNPIALVGDSRMKASFSDFLKLRHGGSGYLFAFGSGPVGTPNATPSPFNSLNPAANLSIAADRPFHSLSYPDIDYTILRPAPLPPSQWSIPPTSMTGTLPAGTTFPIPTPLNTLGATPPTIPTTPNPSPALIMDPGVRNPYLYAPSVAAPNPQTTPKTPEQPPQLPPPLPVRRLFQLEDNPTGSSNSDVFSGGTLGDPFVNQQMLAQGLSNSTLDALNAFPLLGEKNGAVDLTSSRQDSAGSADTNANGRLRDSQQHPYFRSEWLQRIANLSTVRTHQYAVWITVGFFEVTQLGDPKLVNDGNNNNWIGAYDKLGLEIGLLSGRSVRYRSFFILDRTKAGGFNPSGPGDFQKVVLYSHRIQ
jgi:hypothetical protein